MQKIPLLRKQELEELFKTTYQGKLISNIGSSTASIHEAFQKLLQISLNSSNQFFGLCENILQIEGKNKGLCMSVSNFIKFITKKCVDQKFIDQCGPKNFINRIEHIFDNPKISPFFKESIAISFIKAALGFRLNFEKIIEKILYLYHVKDFEMAVLLSRAYLSCSDSCLDPKLQGLHYKKILPAQLKYLAEEVRSYGILIGSEDKQNYEGKVVEEQSRILEVLKNIHSSLVPIPFQKFESSIFVCLQSEDIIKVIESVSGFRGDKKIKILYRSIVQKIIDNLFSMRRFQQLPNLMKIISQLVHDQWALYQQILIKRHSCMITSQNDHSETSLQTQQELSILTLLTSGFSSHIIIIIDLNINIWNLIIVPLYAMKQYILNQNQPNIKETFLVLEDCTFFMKSQSLQVVFNKMLKSILENYQLVASKVVFEVNEALNTPIDLLDQNKLFMLINLLTFQASYFLTQDIILLKVQNFLKFNKNELFNPQNPEMYFQSLLLLYHFLDDLFCQQLDSDIFEMIAKSFILHKKDIKNPHKLNNFQLYFITEIEKLILITLFSSGFTEEQIQKPSQILIKVLSQSFDHDFLNVYINLIKNYNIEDRFTLQVFDGVFESICSSIFTHQMSLQVIHEEISTFMEFLVVFFDLEIYKHLFESTLIRVLPIFEHMISSQEQFEDDFFIIIEKFVTHLQYVPQNYLNWMGNIFNHRLMNNQVSFKSLSVVLQNLSPSKYNADNLKYELFVNCIALNLVEILVSCNQKSKQRDDQIGEANQLMSLSNSRDYFMTEKKRNYSKKQIYCLLCLHQLIHFHSEYLTKKVLYHILNFVLRKIFDGHHKNRQEGNLESDFTFESGKYQLVVVLLFRRRLSEVNQILIQMGMEKKAYNTVYMKENRYLLEYDIPLLIKEQIWILKNLVQNDDLQMAYANTSFMAVFKNFSVLFEMKRKQKGKYSLVDFQSDDSDEEGFENLSQLQLDYKQMTKLVLNFPLPQQWRKIDELKEIKQLILELRSRSGSRQWLQTIYEKCLSQNQKKMMVELLTNLQSVGGRYRQIMKVNKSNLYMGQYSNQTIPTIKNDQYQYEFIRDQQQKQDQTYCKWK